MCTSCHHIYILMLLALLGCGKATNSNTEHKDRISFSQNEIRIFQGEEIDIPVSYQKWNRGVYEKTDYDFISDPANLIFSSSDKSIADVVSNGKIKGYSIGKCSLSVSSTLSDASGLLSVVVEKESTGKKFTQDITQPLTPDMILLPVGLTSVTMQGMEVDKHGTCYMSWEENSSMFVRAYNKDGSVIGQEMALPSGGHGDGFCMEYTNDEPFFWTSGTLGEHSNNGGYAGGKATDDAIRLICRHKYVSGATQYAEDAYECFFLNNNGCRFVEVDTEHDVMACWTYENNKDYFYIFRLSDMRKATKTTKTVSRKSHNNGTKIEAYDLNTIKPIGKFSWTRMGNVTGSTNSGAVQGLCVYGDKIYVESGAKSDDAALISVLDFEGNILQKQIQVGVSKDKAQIKKLNLSSDGTFEPEGVHIHDGVMYLGFVGDYPTSGSKKHACIIKLK